MTAAFRVAAVTLAGMPLIKELYEAKSDAQASLNRLCAEDSILDGVTDTIIVTYEELHGDTWVCMDRRMVRQ